MCDIKQKRCSRCSIDKPLTSEFFHKKLDKFNSHCKECRKQSSKRFYDKNKTSLNKKTRDYYQKNASSLIEYSKIYRAKNKEKLQIYEQRRYKAKSEKFRVLGRQNGATKILHNIRVCISRCIKDKQKSSTTIQYLGCSLEDFKKYLESKFHKDMSWSNYGRPNNRNSDGWHIDHIKPLSAFNFQDINNQEDLEIKLKKAWHYTNLQPLWGLDNISKGSKYENNIK
jgi:hypothetical protein